MITFFEQLDGTRIAYRYARLIADDFHGHAEAEIVAQVANRHGALFVHGVKERHARGGVRFASTCVEVASLAAAARLLEWRTPAWPDDWA